MNCQKSLQQVIALTLAALALSACSALQALPSITPTPTPESLGFGPDSSLPTSGEIESRIPFPMTGEECVSHIPFAVREEQGRLVIEGEGVIDCSSSGELCGEICVTHNHILYADVSLGGEVLIGLSDSPSGVLHVDLVYTGTNTQYFTDYPPGARVLFTEQNPFQVEGSEIIPLTFSFEDGATTEVENQLGAASAAGTEAPAPWTLILYLK